jgi:hypothetical protein
MRSASFWDFSNHQPLLIAYACLNSSTLAILLVRLVLITTLPLGYNCKLAFLNQLDFSEDNTLTKDRFRTYEFLLTPS